MAKKEYSQNSWCPSKKNIYVIPDIHGAYKLLTTILKHLLPLQEDDLIVFLGDYIDRHVDSHLVLDKLIELQQQYLKQIIFLKGNHELMFLKAANQVINKNFSLQDLTNNYQFWLKNGGFETIQGYLIRSGLNKEYDVENFPRFKMDVIVPKEHFQFLQQHLVTFFRYENYLFVHGGCDPLNSFGSIEEQKEEVLLWDRSLLNDAERLASKGLTSPWKETIILGHSCREDGRPIILDKLMMLDCGSPEQLFCMELHSHKAIMVTRNGIGNYLL